MYTRANHGFLLRDATESQSAEQQFHSREKGENVPQLVVTFEPAGSDTTPPETTITSAPPATTEATTATFTFSATEAGSTFECSLDGDVFAGCASPSDLTGLAVGDHELLVRATDVAGNLDPTPASHRWTISPAQGTCSPVTITASADADSWVLQSSSSSNYGTDSVLKVDSKSGGNARALVRFAMPAIPAGCKVLDAKLRLYAGSMKEGRTLHSLRLAGSWLEGRVTWANQPATTGAAARAASGSGYVEWSVGSHVQAIYAEANNGFIIWDSAENGAGFEQAFHSREKGADGPPVLVISFG
jgi:hypothetical protein